MTLINDEMVERARADYEARSPYPVRASRELLRAALEAAAPMIVERCARVADMEVDKCIEAAWRLEAEGHSEDADRCRQHAERAGYVAANIRALASKEDG